jgi:hypothetical protein
MAPVMYDFSGEVVLDLDFPHCITIAPFCIDHLVIQFYELVEVMLPGDIFEIFQNLRCLRVAIP